MIFRTRRLLARTALLCLTSALAAAPAHADNYPSKPIKVVVPGPPAAATDAMARIIAADITSVLAQPIIVENMPGAGGLIATRSVMKAEADGYTIMIGHVATHAIVPALIQPTPYDPVKDFTPVTLIGTAPDLLLVSTAGGIRNLPELLNQGKSGKPISYGTPGVGLPQHVEGQLLGKAAGITMQHIGYRGTPPAMIDLAGDRIAAVISTPGSAAPYLKSGKVKALAIASAERSKFFPDVPTFAELGYPTVAKTVWFGFFAPAGTPAPVVKKLSQAMAASMAKPEIRAKLENLYLDIAKDTSSEALDALVRSEAPTWMTSVKQLGITNE